MRFRTRARSEEVMFDDVIDAYVEWREQSQGVWHAYHRWSNAPAQDAPLRFAAYLAELDQEQRACDLYETRSPRPSRSYHA